MGEFFLLLLGIGILILIIWFGVKILGSVFRGAVELLEQQSHHQ